MTVRDLMDLHDDHSVDIAVFRRPAEGTGDFANQQDVHGNNLAVHLRVRDHCCTCALVGQLNALQS